jgi:UDP-N-acetylglucosamine transferase subunit ALG13
MIFLTVGTILPFDRLAKALDDWAAAQKPRREIFAQVGDLKVDSYRPKSFKWTERVTPKEFQDKVVASELIVTHAGIGTIVTALTHSTPVLIMPRRAALHEIVNDHQLETVKYFADRPGVTVAMEAKEIGPKLDTLLSKSEVVTALGAEAQDSLIKVIQGFIHG